MTNDAIPPGDARATMAPEPGTTQGLVYFEVGVPFELRDAVERHHRNLNLFAHQLRQAGVSEVEATAHLDVAIASYRDALEIAVTSIRSSKR